MPSCLAFSGLDQIKEQKQKHIKYLRNHQHLSQKKQENTQAIMTSTPPADFICQLTGSVMVDPMMSRYGSRFERTAILKWIDDGHNYCPVTANPLRRSNLVTDSKLQWKIHYWCETNGLTISKGTSEDEHEVLTSQLGALALALPPPKRFICFLTKELMKDPVMSRTGHNFERKAILKHLEENDDCPVTKKHLLPSGIVANSKLQWEIRQWQLNVGDVVPEMQHLDSESKLLLKASAGKDASGSSACPSMLQNILLESLVAEERRGRDGADTGTISSNSYIINEDDKREQVVSLLDSVEAITA